MNGDNFDGWLYLPPDVRYKRNGPSVRESRWFAGGIGLGFLLALGLALWVQ